MKSNDIAIATPAPESSSPSTAISVVTPLLDTRPVADLPPWARQEVEHTTALFSPGLPMEAIVVSCGMAIPAGQARRNVAKLHAKALAERAKRLGL